LICEYNGGGRLIQAEGYLYDGEGRRTHRVGGEGIVTKYEYNNQPRAEEVLNPWTEEQTAGDRAEAEEAGLYFTPDKGRGSGAPWRAEKPPGCGSL
jgi:YD repeat-containing protein